MTMMGKMWQRQRYQSKQRQRSRWGGDDRMILLSKHHQCFQPSMSNLLKVLVTASVRRWRYHRSSGRPPSACLSLSAHSLQLLPSSRQPLMNVVSSFSFQRPCFNIFVVVGRQRLRHQILPWCSLTSYAVPSKQFSSVLIIVRSWILQCFPSNIC